MRRGQVISCFKTGKMIDKGCLYHVVRVKELECETPSIESVPVVRDYPKVFPNDLLGHPLKQEIDSGVDLLPDTNPISIPPYWITLAELKVLKLQLKDN